MGLYFPAAQAFKLAMPMKMDDFTLPSFDMQAQDDGTGAVCSWFIDG